MNVVNPEPEIATRIQMTNGISLLDFTIGTFALAIPNGSYANSANHSSNYVNGPILSLTRP